MKASSIVLAGGRSSRMRSNKALAEISGRKLIENILDKVAPTFDEVLIVTNEPDAYADYAGNKIRVITDIIPRKGPLSGIHAGLSRAGHDLVLTVPCDMPFMNMELARHMINMAGEHDGVVPRIGPYFQPLFAAYSRRCLPVIEQSLLEDDLKISDLYKRLNIVYLNESRIRGFGDPAVLFYNVNNRDDLKRAEDILEKVMV